MNSTDLIPFQRLRDRARAACLVGRTKVGGRPMAHPPDCVECTVLEGLMRQTAWEARELVATQPAPTRGRDKLPRFREAVCDRLAGAFELPPRQPLKGEVKVVEPPRLLTGRRI